jgi:hypothetical protein
MSGDMLIFVEAVTLGFVIEVAVTVTVVGVLRLPGAV